ncbi:MAG TPA: DUF5691 domain-containing protein [Actinoplanes sp.]|nr:DUF5691 domain-containing protein [Actinoplanes sp.]
MPVERWTAAQVAALAPDAGSLHGARGLSGRARWAEAGLSSDVLWGLCKGSGKNPYQVCVDLSGPAYKCSCPSRKVPCKHTLGLLMLWSGGEPMTAADPPAFVTQWQASRAARAAAPARPARAADPEAAAKRLRQREDRVAGGMAELSRWLDDQVHQGLAAAERAGWRPFEAMAARLVDAQAPAAASAVRRLGGIVGIGPNWADRLLGEMGLLRLLVCAHHNLGTLPPALAATVRMRIGFPVSAEDVLTGPRVRDRWQVLGQVDSDDGTLMSRRIWLRGADCGRFALLLSFAAPGQTLQSDVVPGTELDAGLCFYPGAYPVRALVAERYGTPVPLTAPAGAVPMPDALAGWAAALAAEPWRHDVPVLLAGVVPAVSGWLISTSGDALPLAPGHREPWWLLAAAGAQPVTVAAEWSASGLRPLAGWADGHYTSATAPITDGGALPAPAPELPSELVAAALVGTARRPWTAPTIGVGGRTVATEGASLLEAASVALLYRRAGVTPWSGQTPVSPAPAEADRPLPAAAGARLRRILSDGGAPGGAQVAQELLAQWLALAAGRGGHVPPDTLPALLDAGRRTAAIRAALGRVAGKRGAWLAAMRDDWRWLLDEAPATTPDDWQTGSRGERLAYLVHLRQADPAAGRRLLEESWAAESPDNRVRFLSALECGLSTADDAFLERALDDRRREVREAALDLLRQLPGSSLARRMTGRALAAVRLERRAFGRDRLIVEPPETLDAELRRDGVAATPARGIGAGAWLLEEILAGTPLPEWTPAFGRTPEAVIDLARGHDWESALVHGWAKAAVAQRDAGWARALVSNDSPGGAGLREAVRWDLHLVLPPSELARIAADSLRRDDHLANRLLAVHPGDWPDDLAVAVIETIVRRARTDRHSWQLSELCRSAALSMPPRYAPHIARLAAELDQGPADPSRVRPVAELARTLTFRHEMHLEFE